ncbi:hypothetical protein U1Q18_040795 [Sarracenia purpurea var. burkii]
MAMMDIEFFAKRRTSSSARLAKIVKIWFWKLQAPMSDLLRKICGSFDLYGLHRFRRTLQPGIYFRLWDQLTKMMEFLTQHPGSMRGPGHLTSHGLVFKESEGDGSLKSDGSKEHSGYAHKVHDKKPHDCFGEGQLGAALGLFGLQFGCQIVFHGFRLVLRNPVALRPVLIESCLADNKDDLVCGVSLRFLALSLRSLRWSVVKKKLRLRALFRVLLEVWCWVAPFQKLFEQEELSQLRSDKIPLMAGFRSVGVLVLVRLSISRGGSHGGSNGVMLEEVSLDLLRNLKDSDSPQHENSAYGEAVILEEELRVKQPSTVGNEVEEAHIIGTDVAEKENEGNDGKSDVENEDESSDGGDGSSTEGLLSEHEACITEQGTKTEEIAL